MTVNSERMNSLHLTREFLRSLLDPKKTPRVPKKVRQEAYYCLKHFPYEYHLEDIANYVPSFKDEQFDGNYSVRPQTKASPKKKPRKSLKETRKK